MQKTLQNFTEIKLSKKTYTKKQMQMKKNLSFYSFCVTFILV